MELQNFEKSMHQKFQAFEPEVNDLKIWDGIESKIPHKKKRRAIFWFCWFGLPIMLLSVLTYIKLSDNNYALIDNQKIEKQTNQKTFVEKQLEDEALVEVLNEEEPVLNREGQDSKHARITSNNVSATENLISVDSQVPSKTAIHSPVYDSASNAEKALTTNTRIIENYVETEKHINDWVYEKQTKSSLLGKDHNITPIISKEDIGFTFTELLPSIMFGVLYTTVQAELDPIWEAKLFKSEGQKKFKAFHSVGLQMGYAKMFTKYQSTDAPLLNLRSNSETPLDQLSFGLMYKYQFSKRFSLQSGLNFWQANWQSLHTTESREVLSINFQQITRTEEISYVKYGKDRALSLPILMEFDIIQKEKFFGSFGLGYEFNLLGTHKGFEIDSNGQEYNIEDDVESRYLNKSGNYLMMQLGAGYNLNEHTLLQINMAYKYGLNAFQTQASYVQKSYRFLGLNAGILKRIN